MCDGPTAAAAVQIHLNCAVQNLQNAPPSAQAYTLQRLVRGLASNRQGARQGFALALTAIVQQAEGVSVDMCVGLIRKLQAVTNPMSVRTLHNVAVDSHLLNVSAKSDTRL